MLIDTIDCGDLKYEIHLHEEIMLELVFDLIGERQSIQIPVWLCVDVVQGLDKAMKTMANLVVADDIINGEHDEF